MIQEHKLNNICNLEFEEIKQILDTCIDVLGVVDINEAKNALCIGRQRVYQLMNEKNTIKIGNHKFLSINLLNNKMHEKR